MSKPGKVLKGLCKKLGVRLTVKRGKKRVYKSVKVLKDQCKRKQKKKKKRKKVKRKRRFGAGLASERYRIRRNSLGTYYGEIKYEKKHGLGLMRYNDGSVYEGMWKDGFQDGYGKFTFTNGSVYEGEWKDGFQDGYGKFTYGQGDNKGDVYEGEWEKDVKNGQGKYTWVDGTVYEGEYKDDEKNGQGKYTWSDGREYKGGFKDDKMYEGLYYDYLQKNKKIILKGHWEYDEFKTGDLYIFKKDDESLNIFQHIKRKIDGDLLESNKSGKDALNEFKKVLKSLLGGFEGFGKKRRKRKK